MEQIRQEVEKKQVDAQQEEEVIRKRPNKRRKRELDEDPFQQEAIQQMTPVNSPIKAVLETTQLLEEGEDPPRVCPFHMEMVGPIVNNKGSNLMSACPSVQNDSHLVK